MIRYIWLAFFAALLISICTVDSVIVHRTFTTLHTDAVQISAELEENGISEEAKNLIEKIEEYWLKKQRPFSIFIHHEETKILGDKINLLKAYIQAASLDEATIEAASLLYEIDILKKQYVFSITNIF